MEDEDLLLLGVAGLGAIFLLGQKPIGAAVRSTVGQAGQTIQNIAKDAGAGAGQAAVDIPVAFVQKFAQTAYSAGYQTGEYVGHYTTTPLLIAAEAAFQPSPAVAEKIPAYYAPIEELIQLPIVRDVYSVGYDVGAAFRKFLGWS